jgi:polyhydroxyalkanoate synthesis regulator phasin
VSETPDARDEADEFTPEQLAALRSDYDAWLYARGAKQREIDALTAEVERLTAEVARLQEERRSIWSERSGQGGR